MKKKLIVIGSGFGGIAAALRMRAKGYDVTLLEKHPDLGGRARVFKKGDFISYQLFCIHLICLKNYLLCLIKKFQIM